MSLINRLLQQITGSSRCQRSRQRRFYSPFGAVAAEVQILENRQLLSALTVTSAADSGAGSLRAEIAAAHSGDTVNFASSLKGQTITLTSGELLINTGVTIQGPGAAQLTISGGHASRVFDVTSRQPVVLTGLTISNGFSQTGGGIDVPASGSVLTVSACTISNCHAGEGGAIRNFGTLTISGSTIQLNNATVSGGGIYNADGGKLTMSQSTMFHNSTYLNGGGIYNQPFSIATLTDCTLSSNQSLASGGVGDILGGGGLYVDFDATVSLTNCTLSLNKSLEDGGGIAVNAAFSTSAGILKLTNTIVAGNVTGNPYVGPDIYGAVATADHNLVGNATGSSGIVNGVNGNIVGGNGNPVINADLGPLQNNGGPTETMALLAGSLAIGHADSTKAPATDERGFKRLDEAGGMTDIGAYEV
jgi:hypothetical protein